jgi:hypothetical protein
VERKQITHENISSDLKEIAAILASNPYKNRSGGGVLNCLGYREENSAIEIIFQLPEITRRRKDYMILFWKIMKSPGSVVTH